MQCSLNRARLRPRRLLQKWWTLSQDYQVVTDKQLMQYRIFLKYNWKMLSDCSKFPKKECPHVWIRLPRHKKPKSWESIEDPMLPLERNLLWSPISCCHGRDNSKKLYLFLDGRKYRIGNVCSFIEYRSFLSIRVDDIKNVWKEAEYGSHVEEIDEQFWILTTTSFLDHEHSGNANRMKQLLNSMRRCLNRVFLLKQTKNCPDGKNLKQKQ